MSARGERGARWPPARAGLALIGSLACGASNGGPWPDEFVPEQGVPPGAIRLIDEQHGAPVIRVEIGRGDCVPEDCARGRERAELTSLAAKQHFSSQPAGGTWYATELEVPESFPTPRNGMGVTLLQLKVPGAHPALDVFMREDGALRVKMDHAYKLGRWDFRQQASRDPVIVPASQLRGRWLTLHVHARWSRGADGFAEVFVDGDRVFSYRGANVATGDSIYVKLGIYRWDVFLDEGRSTAVVRFRRPVVRTVGPD